MTAIAIAQLPVGFVVAADGRMRMDAETRMKASTTELARETEYAQKIFEISDRDKAIAYAITGTIANDDFTFNFVEEAKDQTRLLANRKIDSFTQYANRFCSNLSRKTAKAKQFEKIHATIFFVGYFKTLSVFMSVDFYFRSNTVVFTPTNYSGMRSLTSGSDRVRSQMYDSEGMPIQNSVFSQYAKHLDNDATLDDAVHFTKGYIDACSSGLAREIARDECEIIGGHVHVAQITPPSRFLWRIRPVPQKLVREREEVPH